MSDCKKCKTETKWIEPKDLNISMTSVKMMRKPYFKTVTRFSVTHNT